MNAPETWGAIATVVVPLAALFLPGVVAVRLTDFRDLLFNGARVLLWSVSVLVITTFVAAWLGIPVLVATSALGITSLLLLLFRRRSIFCLSCGWAILAVITPIVMAYAAFAVPYFLYHDGLPTGDIQKSIFWAQDALDRSSLPAYTTSINHLNRDPGDFFTPGLHTFTAAIMALSPEPLVAVGLLSIILAVAVSWIAAAISKEIFDDYPHIVPPLVSALFVLTNFRFLRYLREPGYHYQNIMGELLLFGLMLIGLRLLRRFSWNDALLGGSMLVALVLSHQFSVFVGLFALLPIVIAFLFSRYSRGVLVAIGGGLLLLAIAAMPFGLYTKLPHLFTTTPHLTGLTPSFMDYPFLMGAVWLTLGITGLITLVLYTYRFRSAPRWAFIMSTIILLALSQGPYLGIDIPPVRALFYVVVPLSICAAYLLMHLGHFVDRTYSGLARILFISMLIVAAIVPAASSTVRAYQTTNHAAPPNSTLTAELQFMIEKLAQQPDSGAVLVDDHNRRAASWLLLSGKPMFTRLAGEIERQMQEARQSELRMNLYVNQLAFEKIYSLAAQPEAIELMAEQNIRWVVGILGSSADGFAQNKGLQEIARAGDIVLFERIASATTNDSWLTRTSTLVNDIGDREDTQLHLPASIRSTRVSPPQISDSGSFRVTSAPVIPIGFNVNDFIATLWDQDRDGKNDATLELMITTAFDATDLRVRTPDGATHPLISGQAISIRPADVILTDTGYLNIELLNPNEELVGIDLIALGLGRTP